MKNRYNISAEKKFENLLESAPDAIVIINNQSIIELVNLQTEKLFGYDRKEIIGKKIDILIPDRYRDNHHSHVTKYFMNPKVRLMGKGLELNGKKSNGSEFPVEISLSPMKTPDGMWVSAAIRDISERKAAEKRFENLLESAPDSIVIINNQNIIELVNLQTEKLFGYDRKEIIGKKIDILIPDRYREKHNNHVTNYFKNPKVRLMGKELELNGKKSNGLEFPVEISLSPMMTPEGLWVSAAIRDISERKAVEEKIAKYTIEMEQFAYIASHDLREPLLTIKNYFEILVEEELSQTLNENAKKYIQIIIRASNRMDTLISELLEYSRLSNEIKFEDVDCNELLKQVKEDLALIISSSGMNIHIDNLPIVNANSLKLKLVFQNIINNSIKFRRKDVIPEISITSSKIKNGWQFKIKDNGIGMEEKNNTKIFNMFQRLHNKNEYEGTGIGLAHCKKIVEMHNGKIWVESKLGLYSCFYFTILTENL